MDKAHVMFLFSCMTSWCPFSTILVCIKYNYYLIISPTIFTGVTRVFAYVHNVNISCESIDDYCGAKISTKGPIIFQ